MIKDAIKEELLKLIAREKELLEQRVEINNYAQLNNYDCKAESRFIAKLEEFAKSI